MKIIPLLLLLFIALLATSNAMARPWNPDILKQQCADAGRVAPVFKADICSTCHNTRDYSLSTPQKTAFLTGFLDMFCAPALGAKASVNYQLYDAKAPALNAGATLELTAMETTAVVATGVSQTVWTYNGKLPGPILRAKVGDTITVHLNNPFTNHLAHSVDFHASQMAWNGDMSPIFPGTESTFQWKAEYAGVWMYHCGASPTLQHIANGMYGVVIVEPIGGLPPVDHEFVLVQSEIYLGKGGANLTNAGSGNPSPNYVVFNGVASQYKDHPLEVATGKTVRIFVLNAGPNKDSAFHIVGTIFNRVIKEGLEFSSINNGYGSQAVDLAPSQGAIVEFTTKEDGLYPIVTHAFNFVGRGAIGFIKAGDGDPKN